MCLVLFGGAGSRRIHLPQSWKVAPLTMPRRLRKERNAKMFMLFVFPSLMAASRVFGDENQDGFNQERETNYLRENLGGVESWNPMFVAARMRT